MFGHFAPGYLACSPLSLHKKLEVDTPSESGWRHPDRNQVQIQQHRKKLDHTCAKGCRLFEVWSATEVGFKGPNAPLNRLKNGF